MMPVDAVAAARVALQSSRDAEVRVSRTALAVLASCVALRGAEHDELVAQGRAEVRAEVLAELSDARRAPPEPDATVKLCLSEILDRMESLSVQIETLDRKATAAVTLPPEPPKLDNRKPDGFREKAALLLVDGPLTSKQIREALGLGCSVMAVRTWLAADPWFVGMRRVGFGLSEAGRQAVLTTVP